MFTYLGFLGAVRREAILPDQFSWAMPWMLLFALIVGLGQIIFAYNLGKTFLRQPKAEEIAYLKQQQERLSNEKDSIIRGEE